MISKYKVLILILFIMFVFMIERVDAYIYDLPLLGKTIYLDAGHGGRDPGAMYNNVKEKDITLLITKKIQNYLESYGALVLLTREGDYDLSVINTDNKKRNDLYKRSKLINESDCSMYISIHLNAYTSTKWKGLQIFYDSVNEENGKIAESFTNYLKNDIKNVRSPKEENSYYLHHHVKRPGILIEVGFITNPDDRYLLLKNDYQEKIAKEIAKATLNYYIN